MSNEKDTREKGTSLEGDADETELLHISMIIFFKQPVLMRFLGSRSFPSSFRLQQHGKEDLRKR